MMSDLINRSALLKELVFDYAYAAADIVKAAPAVDAVPVVRCKDCKNTMLLNLFSISDNSVERGVLHCGNRLARVQPDDFCSWGERREVMP